VRASPAPAEAPATWAEAQLQWARALLANGMHAEALAQATPVVEWRRRSDHPASPWLADAECVLGECLRVSGQLDAARAAARLVADRHAANVRLGDHLREPLRALLARLDHGTDGR
jgi:hypothetical protein